MRQFSAALAACFALVTTVAVPAQECVFLPHPGPLERVQPDGTRIEVFQRGDAFAADTLVLSGSGMPNSSALYFQGTAQAGGGAGAVFGDGLRCPAGGVIRLGTKTNAAGASQYPAGGDPPISVRSPLPLACALRNGCRLRARGPVR